MRECISCGEKFDDDSINTCPECGGEIRKARKSLFRDEKGEKKPLLGSKSFDIILVSVLVAVIALVVFLAVSNSGKDAGELNVSGSSVAYTDPRFEQFETALIGKKLQYKRIIKKDHTIVGAKEAYGYEFDKNFIVELYVYDENSEIYKTAAQSNTIPLLDMGGIIPVKFNGTICIYMNNYQHEYADEVNDIFRNIK